MTPKALGGHDPRTKYSATSGPSRIGLLAQGFADWGGGIDFLRTVATSLRVAAPELDLHVLVPCRGPLVQLRNLRDWARSKLGRGAIHRPDYAHLERVFSDVGAIMHKIDLGRYAAAATTRRIQLEAMLPAISPITLGKTPWVGYIYDFQHKHLPQFFTERECARRDNDFAQMLNSADAVIVNAKDVLKDIEHFYPNCRARVFVMPFCPAPSRDDFSVEPLEVIQRYKISGPYFIICNQFWKHKDHSTAFRAFATIAHRHPDLLLVCTGATSDFRFPGYFDQLMLQARQDGIADRILVLGLIPKHDQLALLRGAVALVQPTLFEGGPGGGAVYDAVAVGQKSIVSDIPVNTEIVEPTVSYFKAGDAVALASAMQVVLATHSAAPTMPVVSELIQRGFVRRRACGAVLLEALNHAVKNRRTNTHSQYP